MFSNKPAKKKVEDVLRFALAGQCSSQASSGQGRCEVPKWNHLILFAFKNPPNLQCTDL